MAVVLTCGQKNKGFKLVQENLFKAGLSKAKPSRYEHYTPEKLTRDICKAYKVDTENVSAIMQVQPGNVLKTLTGDLMVANLRRGDWGWADPNTIYLLDYWSAYDPMIKFVLVYSSPEYAVAEKLGKQSPSGGLIDKILREWRVVNSELLRFYNANRNRALLVNSAAVSADGAHFLQMANQRLDVELDIAPVANPKIGNSAIPVLLAGLLVKEAQSALDLFREIESAADMPEGVEKKNKDRIQAAWSQFRKLRKKKKRLSAAYKKLEKKHLEQQSQQENMQGQIHALQEENAALRSESRQLRAALSDVKKELKYENIKLIRERDSLIQEKEILALQLRQAQDELEQALSATDVDESLKQEMEGLRKEISKRDANAATAEKENELLKSRVKDLGKENELLKMRLDQVREELGLYFNKYQEVVKNRNRRTQPRKGRKAEDAAPSLAPSVHEAVIDMRQVIDGENWYYAEHDGRWAGPGVKSTLALPALEKGRYQLELDVVDAIAPDILRGMKVKLNGKKLKLKGGGQFGPLARAVRIFRKKLKYPVTLNCPVWIDAQDAGKPSRLEFVFPRTVSPASKGSDDTRHLAVRIKKVRLSRK